MSTQFNQDFEDGDLIEAEFVKQYAQPIQALESGASQYRADQNSSSNVYLVDFSDPEASPIQDLSDGLMIHFKAGSSNDEASPSTLEVMGIDEFGDPVSLGAVPLTKRGGAPLDAGDIQSGQMVSVLYDSASGGRFEMLGPSLRPRAAEYANSADIALLDMTDRGGWFHFVDSTGSNCRAFVTDSAVTIESGSLDWVASSTPASGEVGLYVTGSALHLVLGSAAARSIGFSDQLIQF